MAELKNCCEECECGRIPVENDDDSPFIVEVETADAFERRFKRAFDRLRQPGRN